MLKLERFVELIEVPDLTTMNVEEEKKRFGKDFVFKVHRTKDAPATALEDTIHAQAPLPHTKDKPSRVPRGLVIDTAIVPARHAEETLPRWGRN